MGLLNRYRQSAFTVPEFFPAKRATCLDTLNNWSSHKPKAHLQVVCVLDRSSTNRLQIKRVLSLESRCSDKSGSKDGLANIGVGTEHLVNAEVFVEQRHV